MMSVSPGMAAGQAGGYFSKEDYYLKGTEQGNSLWCGKGAEALGLAGPVREQDFRAMCRGEDPSTGARIVAPKITRDKESGETIETHRAGNDCTFSAPKSVSIAFVAGVEGIKEAHDAAVVSAIGHFEEHYSHYRSPEGIRSGGLAAAKFDHATSRNIDPQLHSHVLVVNAVHAQDGSWKANEPKAIFQDQKSLGLLYRQELARELQARGFEIVIQDRSQMFIELKGIDPALTAHFSSRRQAIEQQVALWKTEGKFSEVPHARLYEMAALETRDPKREVTREDVAGVFARGFEACGSSAERVKEEIERARSLELGRERDGGPPVEPAAQVVGLAARELTDREAVLDRARLLDQAIRISGGRHGVGELNRAIDGESEGVARLGQDAHGREFYTTQTMRELEARNLEKARGLALSSFTTGAEAREMKEFLDRLALEGVRLTAGQAREFSNEVAGRSGLALTVGDPGTAKTSTLGVIERFNDEVLLPTGREHFSINLACTGKAAREMSLATGRPAFTVESFLNARAASKFALQGEKGNPARLTVAGEEMLISEGAQVVVRVDEASFLGARAAGHLLERVEELRAGGVQAKLHLLGDTKQMQAIQAGDFLRQVQELGMRGELDFAHLTEILRQRDPILLEIARGLNREDRPLGENGRDALLALQKQGDVIEIADRGELKAAAVDFYLSESRELSHHPKRAAAGERQSVILVASTNAERRELNLDIRAARVAAGEIQRGKSYPVLLPVPQGVTVEGYRPGDTVLFSGTRGGDGNMKSWGARLGTEGEVTGIDRERNLVRVRYCFTTKKRDGRETARTVSKDFNAAEMAGKTAIFREEERSFAAGDRIIALKNHRQVDLQNGTLGVIRELDDQGKALVEVGGREVALDLSEYRQIDHAYAVTIYRSQGATLEHSLLFARVRPEAEHARELGSELSPGEEKYGWTSYNALNVAVTRAQFKTHVFTNSFAELARSVEAVDRKTSTLPGVAGPGEVLGSDGPGRNLSKHDMGRALDERISELERMISGPGGRESREHRQARAGASLPGRGREPQETGRETAAAHTAALTKPEAPPVKKIEMELEK